MRHGKKHNHLGRKTAHRKALLRNLAISLIQHKRINTTLAKAKALRRFVEPLATKAKTNSTHSRRVVFSYLQNKDAVSELFGPIADKIVNRPGGYVRVIKTGYRKGDAAEIAMIEFVDFNQVYTDGTSSTKDSGKKKTRRRKSKSAGTNKAAEVTATTEVVEEVATAVETSAVADDLKKIEGIGPKIEELLNAGGINTFSDLAGTDPEKIKGILADAGARFAAHDPTTWPEQSKMAASGDWDALQKWQDELDGGKVVE